MKVPLTPYTHIQLINHSLSRGLNCRMDKHLDTRFDRVEKALGTLADSIAKYNPSTNSAREFVAADAELGKGLEECKFVF